MFPYEKICRFPSASPLDKLVFMVNLIWFCRQFRLAKPQETHEEIRRKIIQDGGKGDV